MRRGFGLRGCGSMVRTDLARHRKKSRVAEEFAVGLSLEKRVARWRAAAIVQSWYSVCLKMTIQLDGQVGVHRCSGEGAGGAIVGGQGETLNAPKD